MRVSRLQHGAPTHRSDACAVSGAGSRKLLTSAAS